MYDVITVGSATVDAYAMTEFCEILYGKNKEECIAYPVGSKILINKLILTGGGGGTNTAVALARLGNKVAFLGKMGTRENSRRIIYELKKEKVNTSLIVRSEKGRTGYSIILDSMKHDRTILAFKGSNNDLKFSEIKLKKLKTKWFYFSTMLQESFKTLEKLASYANKNNIKITFNISSYLAKKKIPYLRNILKKINILVLNKEEATILVGKNDARKYKIRENQRFSVSLRNSKNFKEISGTNYVGIQTLLRKLHKLGPEIVAITDGKHGVHIFHNNHIYSGKPHNIKVVETTGAGDAFASSFLSGMIKKSDIEFAMKLGMTNSESVISHHGAKNKLLSYKEALSIMKKNPIKISKKKL